MLRAVIVGVGAVLAVGCIVAAAVRSISQSVHHTRQTARPRAMRIDDEICVHGDCVHCKASVNAGNGYLLKCRHAVHFTCAKFLFNTSGEVVCLVCWASRFKNKQAVSNEGLRKREINSSKCATCEKSIAYNPKTLRCSHKIHESCWARMEKMACRICLAQHSNSEQAESKEGLRKRETSSSKCATCEQSITDNPKTLKCSHKVHESCWAPIEKMACSICLLVHSNSKQAELHEGLRKREVKSPICVACEESITDNPRILKCSHQMHKSCWARMEASSTTCSRCMEDAGEY